MTTEFYKEFTPFAHLVYKDWEASMNWQGDMLSEIIHSQWGSSAKLILDVSCGVGTQSLALAARGFDLTASDLSAEAVARAQVEAQKRDLEIAFSVCDMRFAHAHHGGGFDVVISAGNALPHLLSDAEILVALESLRLCLKPGGGCIVTMRQYDREERGTGLFKPFGVRQENGRRYMIFQVWDFAGEIYDFSMYFIEEELKSGKVETHVMRSKYYAISPDKVLALMRQSGFERLQRLDNGVDHPAILVGTRPN
jgi:SAM-dependent methyltransferase